MPTYVNDNGTWREVNESLTVNDNGTNREIDEAYVNDNGTWREVYTAEEEMFSSTSFKIGGVKHGPSGGTGTDNIGFAGYNAGDLVVSSEGLIGGQFFGKFSDDFRLLNLPTTNTGNGAGSGTGVEWQEMWSWNTPGAPNGGGANAIYGLKSFGISPHDSEYNLFNSSTGMGNLNTAYQRAQPITRAFVGDGNTNQKTGGSFSRMSPPTSTTYNTASTANGTTNTQGPSHTLKQIFIPNAPETVQPTNNSYGQQNQVWVAIDAAQNSTTFPGEGLTLTTYPNTQYGISVKTFTLKIAKNDIGHNFPYDIYAMEISGRRTSPLVQAARTSLLFDNIANNTTPNAAGAVMNAAGDKVTNLYDEIFQPVQNFFISLNPQIEIFDRVNLPFKSSSGGIEYRRVMSLMWQYQNVPASGGAARTNSEIWFAVEGHGLPTNAWRRMEINGVNLEGSLFTKSEVAASPSSAPIFPAYTLWKYTYPSNAITAFGTIESTINVKLYK